MRMWTVLQQHIQYTSLQADQQFVAPTRANLRCPFLLLLFAFFLFFYPFKLLMSGHCYKMIQALNAKTFSNCSIIGQGFCLVKNIKLIS